MDGNQSMFSYTSMFLSHSLSFPLSKKSISRSSGEYYKKKETEVTKICAIELNSSHNPTVVHESILTTGFIASRPYSYVYTEQIYPT